MRRVRVGRLAHGAGGLLVRFATFQWQERKRLIAGAKQRGDAGPGGLCRTAHGPVGLSRRLAHGRTSGPSGLSHSVLHLAGGAAHGFAGSLGGAGDTVSNALDTFAGGFNDAIPPFDDRFGLAGSRRSRTARVGGCGTSLGRGGTRRRSATARCNGDRACRNFGLRRSRRVAQYDRLTRTALTAPRSHRATCMAAILRQLIDAQKL